MDFTLNTYRKLLTTLQSCGYNIVTFETYLSSKTDGKVLILRHDVDELANNALKIAHLEHSLGIQATYYFRTVKQSNNPKVIRAIADMGHEIGYHYEDLSTANGDYGKAISSFQQHLTYFRQYYPIKTISMHGSSSSKYDNRLLWQQYHLEDFGLIGEPYITLDFDKVFYITDTGYAWDGGKYAVRDVVVNDHGYTFHTTQQIIDSLNEGEFPRECMLLSHTLWCDNIVQWTGLHLREFIRNNIKLMTKKVPFVAKIYGSLVASYWKHSQ